MDALRLANIIEFIALAVLAWILERRDREHRLFAGFISWMAGVNLVRLMFRRALMGAAHPLQWNVRLVYHLDVALVLSWYFVFLACIARYFLGWRIRLILFVWVLTSLATVAAYPRLVGTHLATLIKVTAILSLLASLAGIAWAIAKRERVAVRRAHLMLMLFMIADIGTYLLPYLAGMATHWQLVRLTNVMLLTTCIAFHTWWLGRPRAVS